MMPERRWYTNGNDFVIDLNKIVAIVWKSESHGWNDEYEITLEGASIVFASRAVGLAIIELL